MVKISSGMAVESHILPTIDVKIIAAVCHLGEWAIAVHGMYESHEVSLVLM